MTDAHEIWLVAGGEPGAQRFGQLVQHLRKGQALTVEQLSTQADLAIGTIRAIEQGRRAPSEESGIRLLRRLLPEGALAEGGVSATAPVGMQPDYSFTDPRSGARVFLKFRAKTAGDNRRWSSDQPRPTESRAEAAFRELWSDPERREQWLRRMQPAFATWAAASDFVKQEGAVPPSDTDFGRIVRRISTLKQLRWMYVERLLDWWDEIDSGAASDDLRSRLDEVQGILRSYTKLPDDDLPPSP